MTMFVKSNSSKIIIVKKRKSDLSQKNKIQIFQNRILSKILHLVQHIFFAYVKKYIQTKKGTDKSVL